MLPKSDVGVTIYDDERTAVLSEVVAALQGGSQSYLPSAGAVPRQVAFANDIRHFLLQSQREQGLTMNRIAKLSGRLKRLRWAGIWGQGDAHKSGIHEVNIKGTNLRFAVLEGDTAYQIQQHYEEEIYEYIMKMPEDSVFFDLGASIGNFSLFSAAHGLKTYAFEPDPKNFEALELNRRANAFAELRIFEIAISDGVSPHGVLMSNSKKQRRGDHHKVLKVLENSVHASVLGHLDTEHTVRTLSLDQAIQQLKLPVPDYMKIDIDGSEVAFFKGAAKTLANPKLKGFLIELYKESRFYPRLLQTLADANFELKAEFQITSAGQLEAGLFNMEYVRGRAARTSI